MELLTYAQSDPIDAALRRLQREGEPESAVLVRELGELVLDVMVAQRVPAPEAAAKLAPVVSRGDLLPLAARHAVKLDYLRSATCGRAHTRDDLAGYLVLQTIADDGAVLRPPRVLAEIEGRSRYDEALALAQEHRGVGPASSWAVVADRYVCGHTSRDFQADVR